MARFIILSIALAGCSSSGSGHGGGERTDFEEGKLNQEALDRLSPEEVGEIEDLRFWRK